VGVSRVDHRRQATVGGNIARRIGPDGPGL